MMSNLNYDVPQDKLDAQIDGAMVRNVVLFSVLVYELVAPTLTKNALFAAGELHSEELLSQKHHGN